MENSISDQWLDRNRELDKVIVDASLSFVDSNAIKQVIVSPLDLNTKICMLEVNLVIKYFISLKNISVLEIGGGYGNFCRVFQHIFPIKEYTILDTDSMFRFTKEFLKVTNTNCNFVSTQNINTLYNKNFDLIVSNICFTELPKFYRQSIFKNILPNCKNLFVIDINHIGMEFFNNFLSTILKQYYVTIEDCSNICLQKNHNLYIGKEKIFESC